MKYLALGLIFMSFPFFSGTSQQIKFYGYDGSNSLVPADSVTFGFHPNATIGIDEQLGESDISNMPSQTYGLRVLQRTANDFNCLFDENSKEITFENGFDSKINLRAPSESGKGRYFEVQNVSGNFEGGYFIYLGDYISPQSDINDYYLGFFPAYNCPPNFISYNDLLTGSPIHSHGIIVTPADWATDSMYMNFYFYLEPDSSLINENTSIYQPGLVTFYPNPTSGVINIESRATLHIELFDALGNRLKTSNTNNKALNIEEFPAGLYYLRFYDNNHQHIDRIMKVD